MRYWRVAGNFHKIGELAVVVQAPNWQGGVRKGALALKKLPQLKGKKLTVGLITFQETEAPAPAVNAEQLPLTPAVEAEGQQETEGQTPEPKA